MHLFEPNMFHDKTVVITGAGRGIGRAVAQLFKQHGAKLIAHSGRVGTAGRLEGIADQVIEADFSGPGGAADFTAAVLKQCDRIDVLINNAGTMHGRFPADQLTDEAYQALVALNQTSVVAITRELIPELRRADAAAIINTVSISAKTGGSPGSSIYSATKAFVSTYTRSLARELAPDGIRVNAVSPGTIDTDFHQRYSSPEKLETTRQQIPLGRLGTPEDCAPAFLFFASASLSGYITGQTLEINGGHLMV
ncbi:MAG: SDR family oxidoreductase [Rhizobiaceae bacterium]